MIFISDRQTNIQYPVGSFADNAWTAVLKDYGNTNKLRACPEVTVEPLTTGGSILAGTVDRPWFIPSADPKTIAVGAYGINGWILAGSTGTMLGFANSGVTPTATGAYFWNWTFPGASPSSIPIFGDAIWPDGWPREGNVRPRTSRTEPLAAREITPMTTWTGGASRGTTKRSIYPLRTATRRRCN